MITNQVLLSSVVEKTEGNIVSDMNGEKVMLSIEKGKYYNLGEIGGDIWGYIDSKRSILDIVTELLISYEIDQSQCEEQVLNFINSLVEEGLVVLK